MNTMTLLAAAVVAAAAAFGQQRPSAPPPTPTPSAATYEQLATAIIAIRDTETSLVRDLLTRSFDAARGHLDAAVSAIESERRPHLESAAREVTNIATEGDKPIQAVRQRLLKAGHHHHTDAETQEDYIFIDSREKRRLLELASTVSRSDPTEPSALRRLHDDLVALFDEVMKEE